MENMFTYYGKIIIILLLIISCVPTKEYVGESYKTLFLDSNAGQIPMEVPGSVDDFTKSKDITLNRVNHFLCFLRFHMEKGVWYDIYVDCNEIKLLVLGYQNGDKDEYWIFDSGNRATKATSDQATECIRKFLKSKLGMICYMEEVWDFGQQFLL